jgi:hypothetical protein
MPPFCRNSIVAVITFLCAALLALHAKATVLALPNSWTGGSPAPGATGSQTFTSSGQTATISVNNNGTSATGATWAAGYPAFNSTQTTGGLSPLQNGLQLYATSTSSTSAFILTTVTFATAVTNVSFEIWDVDKSATQFVDTITGIQALAFYTGAVQGASSVTSAVPNTYNTVQGSGLSFRVDGTAGASNTTNQGTVTISFTGPITQFSFLWSNTDPGLGGQAIGVGNINFTPVPEVSALWPVAGLLLLGCGGRVAQSALLRRRLVRGKRRARSKSNSVSVAEGERLDIGQLGNGIAFN